MYMMYCHVWILYVFPHASWLSSCMYHVSLLVYLMFVFFIDVRAVCDVILPIQNVWLKPFVSCNILFSNHLNSALLSSVDLIFY